MRALRVCIVTTLLLGLLAGPADATQTFHSRLKGGTAYAEWFSRSGNTTKNGYIEVSNRYGDLYFSECLDTYGAGGQFVSATCTYGYTTTDFAFTLDEHGLSTARVTALDVRANMCTFDAEYNETCSRTRVDVDVRWTGRGEISRGGYNDRFIGDTYVSVSHFNGTWRSARAAGTIGDLTFARDETSYAQIGFARSGYVDVCLGTDC